METENKTQKMTFIIQDYKIISCKVTGVPMGDIKAVITEEWNLMKAIGKYIQELEEDLRNNNMFTNN